MTTRFVAGHWTARMAIAINDQLCCAWSLSQLLRRLAVLWVPGLILLAPLVRADAVVFLPGYLSSGSDWREIGIGEALAVEGWHDGGHLGQSGPRLTGPGGGRLFYTVDLPTQAPFLVQGQQLARYIGLVRSRHAGERLLLVGHSAGGVLGRLYLVQHPDASVDTLITIASPHRGTETAELGVQVGRSPVGLLTRIFGADTLARSQALYADLIRERPGSFLYWLNNQPHPQARYVSVVRTAGMHWFGDVVVPAWSQDMNGVAALRGRSIVIPTAGGHGLDPSDARLLARLLE